MPFVRLQGGRLTEGKVSLMESPPIAHVCVKCIIRVQRAISRKESE